MSDTQDDTQPDVTEVTEVTERTEAQPVAADDGPDRRLPDLDAVQATITEAHEAQDHLDEVMPGAIQSDDDAYEGMSGATAGDVEETDGAAQTDDEREARSEDQPAAEQVQEEVIGGEDTENTADTEDTEDTEDTDRS